MVILPLGFLIKCFSKERKAYSRLFLKVVLSEHLIILAKTKCYIRSIQLNVHVEMTGCVCVFVMHGIISWLGAVNYCQSFLCQVVWQPMETPGSHFTLLRSSPSHNTSGILQYVIGTLQVVYRLNFASRWILFPVDRARLAVSPCLQSLC